MLQKIKFTLHDLLHLHLYCKCNKDGLYLMCGIFIAFTTKNTFEELMMREILHEIGVAARAIFVPCPNAYKPRNLQEKLADMIKVDRTKYFFQQRKEKRISIYK